MQGIDAGHLIVVISRVRLSQKPQSLLCQLTLKQEKNPIRFRMVVEGTHNNRERSAISPF